MKSTMLMVVLVSMLATASARSGMAQNAEKQEADAYKAFFDANQARDIPSAVRFAKAYLEKFSQGKYATYLKGWVRPHLFNEALTAKKTDEMIQIGDEVLAAEPENLEYLYLMAVTIRTNELSASPPNYSHGAEAAEFSQRAIKLIEAGKVPTVVPKDNWKQGPILGMLYQTVGLVALKKKDTDKALGLYKKAAAVDPANPSYFLGMGSIYQEKYGAAATKYQAFPQAERDAAETKAEVKAALDEANAHADMVIENWAKFMSLTAGSDPWKPTRDQVNGALTTIYNYRHPYDVAGLRELIGRNESAIPNSTAAERRRPADGSASDYSTRHPMSPQEIFRLTIRSVVLLVIKDAKGQPVSLGSGFFVRPHMIVTNYHVIKGAVGIYAESVSSHKVYPVDGILVENHDKDIALLRVPGEAGEPLILGDSGACQVGDAVYAVGNPKGLEGTFSPGIVSGIRDSRLQITSPISPGSSGGPVVNDKGEVIGIAVSFISGGQNLNFAVPASDLKVLLNRFQ